MMRQLIAKYGDDFKAMFKDIKMNFMQYSKGQLKAKYKSFYFYGHHNNPNRIKDPIIMPKKKT